ncbi:exodeoxyribonuclease V subunit gamma [Psychrosphaera aquimarina]|uniref:RecBCD enzyme subunit RecC n=1 Tax=Psychrosphaera aquimarina TaxID=2044854 RepID=A0ABU3QWJ4_9GAMM|nr:exodeoxyribonuclease V subunit gamma [Psychrosphaera aquimarina]MDU0111797.1 exodeoxyribonuclease V subunit gamma [Psychrosphaera aquimarina]
MLNLYQSNRLEALVTLLSTQIKFPISDNALTPETILVHSPGMSQWLKLQIAEANGIAANIDFPLPSSFIWRLYQNLLPDVPAQSPFNKDRMTWKLYQLLPEHLNKPEFKSIADYLNSDKPIAVECIDHHSNENHFANQNGKSSSEQIGSYEQLRLFQLAEKIADVFDNYLMYRPEWLEHWQQGHLDLPKEDIVKGDDIKGQQWQCILWQALVTFTDQQNQSPLHRASMHKLLLDKLSTISTEELKVALPTSLDRLFIFGISTLPTHQLEVLEALSQHIDVQILWLNPCSQYWGDILSDKTIARLDSKQKQIAELNVNHKEDYFVTGNPLLASWGKVGRDYLDVLTNANINITDVFIEPIAELDSFSSLEKIQNDILNLQYRGEQTPLTPKQINSDHGKVLLTNDDDSILVHNCHSRIRELEVLKDQLLGWFEQDPTLLPKDILVMVPDVNQYAPFIESIFKSESSAITSGNNSSHNQTIPFTISDRGGLEENPLLNTFIDLLLLPSSRFTVSELLDHLEVPAVMSTFNLSLSDINLLKQWIEQSQIKWAIDAKHKAKWQLPEIDLNTWVYGLKRMVLGVSLGEEGLWNNILAYEKIEGLNQAILGKLLNYFSFLAELEQILNGDKTIEQWCELLEQFVTHLFTLGENEQQTEYQNKIDVITIQKIRNSIAQLHVYLDERDYTGDINYHLIHHFFAQHLSESGVAQRFLAGRMNFCTLMPMRSVPFKVICILGLNDGDYPRHVDPISFDLVGLNSTRKGDRSRKLDERYLFLEAISSAREKLHLSFIGQSAKNNKELMPSVILSELIDYMQQSFIVDNPNEKESIYDRVVIKHKLQPFNSGYFLNEGGLSLYKSYSERWYQVCKTQNSVQSNSAVSDHFVHRSSEHDHSNNHQDPNLDRGDQNIEQFDPIKLQKDQIDLSELIEFWTHPIKYFYRRVLDIKLDLNKDVLSDHEVFQHDGLQKYKNQSALLDLFLFNNPLADDQNVTTQKTNKQLNQKYLRSGNYPAKKWGEKVLDSYQKQSLNMVNLIKEILSIDHMEQLQLTKHQHLVSLDLPSSLTSKLGLEQISVQSTVETFITHNQQVSLFVRSGKIRKSDTLSAWLIHLSKCAAFNASMTILIGNDDTIGWFEPLQPEHANEQLSLWATEFVRYKNQNQMLTWHIDPAVDWLAEKQKGASKLGLNAVLTKHITPNTFNLSARNLASDDYASKHLFKLEQFDDEFERITVNQLSDMAEQYQSGKTKKVIKQIKELVNLK